MSNYTITDTILVTAFFSLTDAQYIALADAWYDSDEWSGNDADTAMDCMTVGWVIATLGTTESVRVEMACRKVLYNIGQH